MTADWTVCLDSRLELERLGCPVPEEMAGAKWYRVTWADDGPRQAFASASGPTDAKRIVRALCGGLGQQTYPLVSYSAVEESAS